MTIQDRGSAQNSSPDPAVVVDLRDQDFFFDHFFQGSDLKIGFAEKKTGFRARSARRAGPTPEVGTRLTLVYATPYSPWLSGGPWAPMCVPLGALGPYGALLGPGGRDSGRLAEKSVYGLLISGWAASAPVKTAAKA